MSCDRAREALTLSLLPPHLFFHYYYFFNNFQRANLVCLSICKCRGPIRVGTFIPVEAAAVWAPSLNRLYTRCDANWAWRKCSPRARVWAWPPSMIWSICWLIGWLRWVLWCVCAGSRVGICWSRMKFELLIRFQGIAMPFCSIFIRMRKINY